MVRKRYLQVNVRPTLRVVIQQLIPTNIGSRRFPQNRNTTRFILSTTFDDVCDGAGEPHAPREPLTNNQTMVQ